MRNFLKNGVNGMSDIRCENCAYWSRHLKMWGLCTQRNKDTMETDSCIMWMMDGTGIGGRSMTEREAIHKLILFRRILEKLEKGVIPVGYRFDAEPFDLAISALEKPEREKGEWIPWQYHNGYRCNKCGEPADNKDNFCSYCGADMRGETNDAD